MPRIAEFYGIAIYMYYSEHPPPHIHAIYGEHEAILGIRTNRVLAGRLPKRALSLVRAWTRARRKELLADWELARRGMRLRPVEPLE